MEEDKVVQALAALAHPLRLRVFRALVVAGPEGATPGTLLESIDVPATSLSFHLKELSRTGVLEPRPEGRFILYSLRRPALKALALYIAGLAGARNQARGRKGTAGRTRRGRPVDSGQLTIFGD